MKKQYIAPELSIELLEASQTILKVSDPFPHPGAPQRGGEAPTRKLGTLYI